MRKIFLDTGYLLALETVDDQYHKKALVHWKNFSKSLPLLLTTSLVFGEVVTFFNSRNRHDKAVEIGNVLLTSASVEFVHIDEDLFREAWSFFVQHSDKSYSFTDCTSFVVMKQLHIRTALSFDHHFEQAGFQLLP